MTIINTQKKGAPYTISTLDPCLSTGRHSPLAIHVAPCVLSQLRFHARRKDKESGDPENRSGADLDTVSKLALQETSAVQYFLSTSVYVNVYEVMQCILYQRSVYKHAMANYI